MTLPVEIQILSVGNIWIFLPSLPTLIGVLKNYPVHERCSGCFYHHIFYLLFRKSLYCFAVYFYNNTHAFCNLCDHMLQTHLATLISFELSEPLSVSMTTRCHHESLPLLVLSHPHIVTQNPKVCCTLAVQCIFFQGILNYCFYLIKQF